MGFANKGLPSAIGKQARQREDFPSGLPLLDTLFWRRQQPAARAWAFAWILIRDEQPQGGELRFWGVALSCHPFPGFILNWELSKMLAKNHRLKKFLLRHREKRKLCGFLSFLLFSTRFLPFFLFFLLFFCGFGVDFLGREAEDKETLVTKSLF